MCKATTFWDVTPYSLVHKQQYLAGDKDTSSSFVRTFFFRASYLPNYTASVDLAFHVIINTKFWKWFDVNLIHCAVHIS